MAKIPFGILGAFFGKVGTVSGYSWKNKAVMRALRNPIKTDKNPTPAQAQQRTKFGFTSHFLGGTGPLVKSSYRELAIELTEFQCAVSYNVCNAVSGTAGNFKVHYELVSVGRGTLPNAVLPEAKAGAGKINFIWADNTGIGTAGAADKAVLAVYCPADKTWHYATSNSSRSDCSAQLEVPACKGKTVHTWLTFVAEGGKAADSVYTGELVVG